MPVINSLEGLQGLKEQVGGKVTRVSPLIGGSVNTRVSDIIPKARWEKGPYFTTDECPVNTSVLDFVTYLVRPNVDIRTVDVNGTSDK